MGFGIFRGSLVVSVGGYEHFESGVLILNWIGSPFHAIVISIINIWPSTLAKIRSAVGRTCGTSSEASEVMSILKWSAEIAVEEGLRVRKDYIKKRAEGGLRAQKKISVGKWKR